MAGWPGWGHRRQLQGNQIHHCHNSLVSRLSSILGQARGVVTSPNFLLAKAEVGVFNQDSSLLVSLRNFSIAGFGSCMDDFL